MDDLSHLISTLRRLYALSTIHKGPWHARLRTVADQAMSDGIYCELFRVILYDRNLKAEEAQTMLASTIEELDPSAALPDHEECNQIYIETRMRELLTNPEEAIEIAHDLIEREYNQQLFASHDFSFMGLKEFMETYYQWWADYSEWMVGLELETQRKATISELQEAASAWLTKHCTDK